MFATYDMNPIAIRQMQEERMAALENAPRRSTRPLVPARLLPAIGSLGALVLTFIIHVAEARVGWVSGPAAR